ncbi:two-component system response regulator YesN [Mobilisporobacter senegalensis]|uniref:Stage 0 sporulation protein A homolog n=1 Tax=Mobilisporobacter senegalensis TaxID=1329262 RepID=A0A3N1XLE8_9FIRM|nr:response regulator [Mobilisporobacter senegalensis]ROR27520.1 two-component system response regulator YesN [Mobilisporobacter senegalensis]
MTYRALVADDEDIIRRGIIRLLKKYDTIEVVAEAEDGEIALEIAEKTQLDVLFVDINMPFLNGFQFIEKLKEIQPNAVVIIITGYDDFEYARQALRLGVNEYLLKPLMEETFNYSLDKVIKIIEEKNSGQKYIDQAKKLLNDNSTKIITDTINKWLKGHYSNIDFLEKADYLSIKLPNPFLITLIHLEYMENGEVEDKWDNDLLYYAAENIAKEVFEELSPIYSFRDSNNNLVLISESINRSNLNEINNKYYETVSAYLPAKIIMLQEVGGEYQEILSHYRVLTRNMNEIVKCPNPIKIAKEYIEKNYNKEDFSLLDMADYMNLSPQHLSRLFKKEVGITFVDYLTRVRTRKSIELLCQHDMKIYEIAEKVGYSSQHYFSSVFKKETGMSPVDYRKNVLDKNINYN